MKKVLVLLMVILVLLAGACGGAQPAPASEPAADTVDSGRCGDRSQLSESVSFYNWTEYIDPEILSMFEEECGVQVIYDTFSSNEDLLAKLQAGATGYDLIVPSDYMVTIMRQLGLLRELDHAHLPNLAHIGDTFANAPYDPGMTYSVPYQWGAIGLGYDLDALGGEAPDSLAAILDPEQAKLHAGKLSMVNDGREVIGAALKYLGYSVNTTDPVQLEEAKQVILAIKPYIAAFDSDSYDDLLVSGDVVIGHGWNGQYFQAIFENENRNLGFVIPKEGEVLYVDTMAIPATAPNPYTAEVLINYLLDPEIGAMLTNYTYYASPNTAAEPYILDEIKQNPGIYPPPEVLAKMEFMQDVGEVTQLYERIWTEIKAE